LRTVNDSTHDGSGSQFYGSQYKRRGRAGFGSVDTRSLSPEEKEIRVKVKKHMIKDLMHDPTLTTAISKFNNPNFTL
jgi:hypothetical protein